MSYGFMVTFKAGEDPKVECGAPQYVPDGTYSVSGHEDDNYRSVAITAQDPPDGNGVASVRAQATSNGKR